MKIENDHLTIGFYMNDIIHGQCTTYFIDGSKTIMRFKEGVKHGEQLYYDKKGQSKYEMYKDGVETSFKGAKARRATIRKDNQDIVLEYCPDYDRCEPIRLMLDYAGVNYREKKINKDQAHLQKDLHSGVGLPVATIDGHRYD